MDFRYAPEDEAFRKEVNAFFDRELPPDWLGVDPGPEEESRNDYYYQTALRIWRRCGEMNWLGLTWPKEYGGQGASVWKEAIFMQEAAYRGAPAMDMAPASAELILQFGTEEQKKRFVVPIARGQVKWATGMSEPNAGTDTFNLQIKAVEEADVYLLNGQKIWTSNAHHADYLMMFTRTDPNKHMGVTAMVVDAKSPGITMRQITQPTGIPAFCEVFFDNVRVPKENVIGKKNGGMHLLLYAFGIERSYGLLTIHNARRYLEMLIQYCQETVIDGLPLSKDPLVRNKLAQLAIDVDVCVNLGLELTWLASKGLPTVRASAAIKILGGQTCQKVGNVGMQVMGLYGPLDEESKWAQLGGRMRHTYISALSFTLAGGTTETSKNHVAGKEGLGLPKQI